MHVLKDIAQPSESETTNLVCSMENLPLMSKSTESLSKAVYRSLFDLRERSRCDRQYDQAAGNGRPIYYHGVGNNHMQ